MADGPIPDHLRAAIAARRERTLSAVVRSLSPGARRLLATVLVCLSAGVAAAEGVRVSFDPSQRFQTVAAWEATVDLFWPKALEPHREEIFDRLLDEIGITRLRVGIFSGAENTDGAFAAYRAGQISAEEWRRRRCVTVNDDDDPFHINPAGFDFSVLDWRIETTVLPIRERAAARGRKVEVNLNYVAFTRQNQGGPYIHTDAEEYAEFILAAFLHMQEKYGFVPDALEVLQEPENSPEWTPDLLGRAVAAATARLKAAGFAPRIIAPSVADARHAVPWIAGIAAVPGAMEQVRELSYHRYSGGRRPVMEEIAAEARRLGLETSMLEYWFDQATDRVLFSDLTVANVSAWQGNTVSTHHQIDPARPRSGALILKENARHFRQYTAYIRPGDTRIGAESSDRFLADPVAFQGPDGAIVLVIRSGRGGPIEIPGLPAGTYHVSYAVEAGSGRIAQPFAVVEGTPLIVEMPGKGVLTVTSRAE